jgi:hypothetical protein
LAGLAARPLTVLIMTVLIVTVRLTAVRLTAVRLAAVRLPMMGHGMTRIPGPECPRRPMTVPGLRTSHGRLARSRPVTGRDPPA